MADPNSPNDSSGSSRADQLKREAARAAETARTRAAGAIDQVRVAGNQLVDRVRELIEEGNVRRIAVKRGDKTLLEIPLTVGAGAGAAALLFTPVLAALGAMAVLVSEIDLVVEREGGDEGDMGGEPAPNVGTSGDDAKGGSAKGGDAKGGDGGRTIGRGASASEGGDAGI